MLKKFDDPSGSEAACTGVAKVMIQKAVRDDQDETLLSAISALNEEESRILADAYLCVGESRLLLYSSSYSTNVMKRRQLLLAKESFEETASVDPSNPAARAGLGLTHLLLGTMKPADTDSIQHIAKSILQLKVTVSLANEINAIRVAAMHNLGLALLALDDIGMAEKIDGIKTINFLDWVKSLRNVDSSIPLMSSLSFSANEGSILLQMGKYEDAVAILERTAGQFCGEMHIEQTTSPSQQKNICSIVERNLSLAREVLFRNHGDKLTYVGVATATHEKIKKWNAKSSGQYSTMNENTTGLISTADSENESQSMTQSDDRSNLRTAIDVEVNTIAEIKETELEKSNISKDDLNEVSEIKQNATANQTTKDLDNNIKTAKDENDTSLRESKFVSKNAKPELHSALVALEKAASGEGKRTRLLIALAKARSSAGDTAGAVNAALDAVEAAKTEEEAESSTSYLEQLMEKLVDNGGNAPFESEIEDKPVENTEKQSSFVETRDHQVSELHLKLEIEKLKYKILEQEMRWGIQSAPTYSHNTRTIDYPQHDDSMEHTSFSTKRQPKRVEFEEDGVQKNIDNIKDDDSVKPDTSLQQKPIEYNQEEVSEILDTEQVESVSESSDEGTDSKIDLVDKSRDMDQLDGETEEVTQTLEEAVTPDDNDEQDANLTIVEEATPVVDPIVLPSLYSTPHKQPPDIPATAKSYMKLADAYLDKGKYSLATKQFLKVIKKAPEHLPAYLGYATALERLGKNRQIHDAVIAYGNATKIAVAQGENIDPLAVAGNGGMAESILRRAIQLAQSVLSGRLELLKALSAHAHTYALAADVHYAIGTELVRIGIDKENNKAEAIEAFTFAIEYIAMRQDGEAPFHLQSVMEIGRIALEYNSNANQALEYFDRAKTFHKMKDDDHVKLLVLSGQAHALLGELDLAVSDLTRALSFPECPSTASAHHELAIALMKNGGEDHEVELHFEKALEMGRDPTPEAIEVLGEHNMAVMRAINRQQWKTFSEAQFDRSGGGIMSGGGVGSNKSVFAPKAAPETDAQQETLDILEQGAAAYDGHIPMGGELAGGSESNLSNLSGRKQR